PTLRALTPSEASSIRFVELLYPLEALERVSIVDTPGVNAILPRHAAAARPLPPWEAAPIRFVERLSPLEALERVSIVDTPGLNSILPEHEATARQFIAQADAVVWLFTALQAGKASEREALERIRGEGKRVLGVVNKVDLADEGERAQILA